MEEGKRRRGRRVEEEEDKNEKEEAGGGERGKGGIEGERSERSKMAWHFFVLSCE